MIGSFRQRLARIFNHQENHKWKHVLKDVVNSYNGTVHSTLKRTPNFAHKNENSNEIWNTLYKKYAEEEFPKAKLRAGQQVRISRVKKTFEKGSTRRFTNEVFTIKQVLQTKPVSYILYDTDGKTEILGGFYERELLRVP